MQKNPKKKQELWSMCTKDQILHIPHLANNWTLTYQLYYSLCVAISQRIFESQYNIVNLNSFTKMNSEGEVMYKQRIIELNQSSHSRV